jgi:hypothetical protein
MPIKRNMQNILVLIVASAFVFQNCATTTKGTSQEMPVTSNPTGAKITKKGAFLVIQKKNGEQIIGELIAVKKSGLLLNISGMDGEVEINDIRQIKIENKSQAGRGAINGLIAAGAVMAAGEIVALIYAGPPSDFMAWGGRQVLGAIYFGSIGAGIGALIGALAGKDEVFQIEGCAPKRLPIILAKLRTQARFPEYQ